MQDKEKIIINYHIQDDPLSEENLDKTLNYLHEFRLLMPQKTIWLYSGFTWTELFKYDEKIEEYPHYLRKDVMEIYRKRQEIIKNVDVLIDGRYIDSQRDISLKWCGSSNQRVIDVKKSLKQNKVVLYE